MGIFTSLLLEQVSTKGEPKNVVCCLGDSLTFGHGLPDKETQCYPARLQRMLLTSRRLFRVINCGVSGACATRTGDLPYWETHEYRTGVAANPSFVVLLLGTNDCKPDNWNIGTFEQDLKEAVACIHKDLPDCRLLLCRPPPIFLGDLYSTEHQAMLEAVDKVAKAGMSDGAVSAMVDLYEVMSEEHLFPDFVHPGAEGAQKMAQAVNDAILDVLDENEEKRA